MKTTKICLPVKGYLFREEVPQKSDSTSDKTNNQPQSIDDQIAALKESNPKLFNTIFGRAVKKGKA